MFVVIFEVLPKADRWDEYLSLAKFLKPELEQIQGFIDNERFATQRTQGKLLSLSTWSNEKALVRWRTVANHHDVQEKGRFQVFADYHLRVGEVTADTDVPAGASLRQQRFDVTDAGQTTAVAIVELTPAQPVTQPAAAPPPALDGTDGLIDIERYDSIYTPGKVLWLVSWRDDAALAAWQARQPQRPSAQAGATVRWRAVRVIRDYGIFDRAEAPQYYPPVPATG